MRLDDLEKVLTLKEEDLTQQQISNLFASVELVVTRDPLGTNRTLLGRGLDKLIPKDQMQTAVKNALDHLKKQIGFSTADPTVGPKIESIEREIIKKTKNDTIITQKLQQYKTMMLKTPKLQKFMIDLFDSINNLVDGGIDRDPLMKFLTQVDQEIINKIPAQMGSAASTQPNTPAQPGGTTPSQTNTPAQSGAAPASQGGAPVAEGIFDLNKIDRKKIISAWVAAGRPTDSNEIVNVLKNIGVGIDQRKRAYELAKIPYPETTSSASTQSSRSTQNRKTSSGSARSTTGSASTTQSTSTREKFFADSAQAINNFELFFSKVKKMKPTDQKTIIDHIQNKLK